MRIETVHIKNLKDLLTKYNLKSIYMTSPNLVALSVVCVSTVMIYQRAGTQKLEVHVFKKKATCKNERLKRIFYDMTEVEVFDIIVKEFAEQVKREYTKGAANE